jgi:hypothetical protein
METMMTRKIRRPKQTVKSDASAATTVAERSRRGSKTKKEIAMALLERPRGASLAEMQSALGWQAHSVRGFLAGTVKKMPDITLLTDKPDNGPRRYRVQAAGS